MYLHNVYNMYFPTEVEGLLLKNGDWWVHCIGENIVSGLKKKFQRLPVEIRLKLGIKNTIKFIF